jgi:hypothetical protein
MRSEAAQMVSQSQNQSQAIHPFENTDEEALLSMRICDLPIGIAGTWLADAVNQLYQELDAKGIDFHPECYLADEWFTPVEEPVIGIPFYLAHPVLLKLEKKFMLEAEGESKEGCLQLLRHEAGHALSYAYGLHKKKKWKDIFGSPSQEYGDTYRFRPYSKNFVRHLGGFYAQFHPDEDFVETFAVWLTPHSGWEQRYKGWKALEKLHYVDALMKEVHQKPPLKIRGRQLWHMRTLRITLRNYYKKKRAAWAEEFPDFHDDHLYKMFGRSDKSPSCGMQAAQLINTYRRRILEDVCFWSGERKYVINNLIKSITKRCQALELILTDTQVVTLMRLTTYITTLAMNYAYTGRYRGDKKKRKH